MIWTHAEKKQKTNNDNVGQGVSIKQDICYQNELYRNFLYFPLQMFISITVIW